MKLTGWTRDIVMFTSGGEACSREHQSQLHACGIEVYASPIRELRPVGDGLEAVFDNGVTVPMRALFFTNKVSQSSLLSQDLGCRVNEAKGVATDKLERTSVPGIFAAGNMIKEVEFVIVAAAEGAKAALGINHDLILDDLRARGLEGVEI